MTRCGIGSSFLESEFTKQEEDDFLSYYESDKTPVSREKIRIYKSCKILSGVCGQCTKKLRGLILEITVSIVTQELSKV